MFPNARIIIDRFHIVHWAVRRENQGKTQKQSR
ncbi:hypothetical protein [Ligilactobacillus ruminis]